MANAEANRLFRFAERLQDERDAALAELAQVKAELDGLKQGENPEGAEAVKLVAIRNAAFNLRRACGSIINRPTSDRTDVQSKLLHATQKYDNDLRDIGV